MWLEEVGCGNCPEFVFAVNWGGVDFFAYVFKGFCKAYAVIGVYLDFSEQFCSESHVP